MHKQLGAIIRALGGETRLAILSHLKMRRSMSVSDIASATNRSVNTVSLHLSHLESLGILERRRRGQEVFYRLSVVQNPIVKQVLKAL